MNAYSLSIQTKLGSVYQKTFFADSEDEAIASAQKAFPLHKSIEITSSRAADPDESFRLATTSNSARIPIDIRSIQKQDYEKGKRKMLVGGLLFGIGLSVTAFTYLTAVDSGVYLLFWGPIGYGFIDFYMGYQLWKRNKPEISVAQPDELATFRPKNVNNKSQ